MTDPYANYIDRLRKWRNYPDRDLSLGFIKKLFKQQVERPYKQLASVAQVWEELVPEELARHTQLESFSRGVLNVTVDSSARLYQLDRLLRRGLQRQLVVRHRGPALQRIKLRVGQTGDSQQP